MKNITVILPIHNLKGEYNEMFSRAILSVEQFHDDVSLLLVGPKNVLGDLKRDSISDKFDVNIIINDWDTGFCSQVNLVIDNCETEWFSILEIDDEYTPNWVNSFRTYHTLFPDADILLPIVKDVNSEGKLLNFTNESVWAYGFSENQGELNNEILLDYQNYQTSGGFYKTDVVKESG